MADVSKYLDKAYEQMDFAELAKSPVEALAGVSAADAEALAKALGIKTIADLATNKYVLWAQAITTLSKYVIERAAHGAARSRPYATVPTASGFVVATTEPTVGSTVIASAVAGASTVKADTPGSRPSTPADTTFPVTAQS